MGNSIFDEDDFTLAGGVDGNNSSTPANKAPVEQPERLQRRRPQANNTAPKQGNAPVPPRSSTRTPGPVQPRTPMPQVNRLTSKAPTAPKAPVAPSTSALPTTATGLPPAPSVRKLPPTPLPVKRIPDNTGGSKLPVIPVAPIEPVIPTTPIDVEPEDISYDPQVQEVIHDNYNPPINEVDEREEERKREYELEQERKERERRAAEREREREEEREREREREEAYRKEREERQRRAKEREESLTEDESTPEPAKKRGFAKKASPGNVAKSGKSSKAARDPKKPGKYSGPRKKILILRLIAFGLIAVFVFAGVKASFFPAKGPTPTQVIATVKKGIGMTKFPTEQASAFVIGFSKIYLSVDQEGVAKRQEDLKVYAPQGVINLQQFSQTTNKADLKPQVITGGPYISGVVSKDDNNAVFTVAAQVNNGQWLYIDVPVFYDLEKEGFAVSGTPAFVPAPEQVELTPTPKEWTADDRAAVESFTVSAKIFFEAWAASDKDAMKAHKTDDADTATNAGLNGTVKLKSLNTVSVQPAEGAKDPNIRKARVSITWESTISPGTLFTQFYDLELHKVQDANQWKIHTLNGGIPTEKGN